MINKYRDRAAAGEILAASLTCYANKANVIVLALPRGGVPVAYEIACRLFLPLDVLIVRKLGIPGQEELAFGAIAMDGSVVFNENILAEIPLSKKIMDSVIRKEEAELKRRMRVYRDNEKFPDCLHKKIILVDDGVATGATMQAAVMALKPFRPKEIIIAIPVAAKSTAKEMKQWANKIICPLKPDDFYAVGFWYDFFPQTSDEEVTTLLQRAKLRFSSANED